MRSPATDPGFVQNAVHGLAAQRQEARAVSRLCRYKRLAVDVGAHVGIWSELLREFGFGTIHAFEPVPELYRLLEENVSAYAHTHCAALGALKGSCRLVLPPGGNSGMHRIGSGISGPSAHIRTLDSYDLANVDLIKIDVEGFEGEVVDGARETIERSKPVIVFEDNGVGTQYFGKYWKDPKPLLTQLGYRSVARMRKDEVWTPA